MGLENLKNSYDDDDYEQVKDADEKDPYDNNWLIPDEVETEGAPLTGDGDVEFLPGKDSHNDDDYEPLPPDPDENKLNDYDTLEKYEADLGYNVDDEEDINNGDSGDTDDNVDGEDENNVGDNNKEPNTKKSKWGEYHSTKDPDATYFWKEKDQE